MLLLLDENTWPELEGLLAEHGIAALHVNSLGLDGRSDPDIFRFALEHGYDAIVTKDAYRKAVRLTCSGPCATACGFSGRGSPRRTRAARARGCLPICSSTTGPELERSLEPDSAVRLILLNARQHGITRTIRLDEIEAELLRRGG